ncbi:hypothetical protein BDV06DRAFT_184541 [Aspergillus oleicola]
MLFALLWISSLQSLVSCSALLLGAIGNVAVSPFVHVAPCKALMERLHYGSRYLLLLFGNTAGWSFSTPGLALFVCCAAVFALINTHCRRAKALFT